jgi:hypothetical protein
LNEPIEPGCGARALKSRALARVSEKAYVSAASLTVDFRFDLLQGFRTMLGGDLHEFLAVRVTAFDFVKTTRRVARPADHGSACENIVHKRSGLGAVKQAGARLGF